MNINDIKDLILTIDKTEINTFEVKTGNTIIKLSKSSIIEGSDNSEVKNNDTELLKEDIDKGEDNVVEDEDVYIVKSPLVGTYYESPSPDSNSFVKKGCKVNKGDTLCIIEAMKIMNEIESEVEGEIIEILVKNEEIVEYGQPIMKIRR